MKKTINLIKRDRYLLLLVLPAFLLILLFNYIPMGGLLMAFENYSTKKGIFGSEFVGLENFKQFFSSIFAFRVIKNTFLLSFLNLLWGFPIPIIFALMLNELKNGPFKKVVQTVSYLPHFVSTVVIIGMMISMFDPNFGLVNVLRAKLGLDSIAFMSDASWFRTLFVGSEVWQNFGWNSIIYIAAIAGISQDLYEAAKIDGANRFQLAMKITLPSLVPTILTLFILNCGWMFSLGFEKVILMYSPGTYAVSDIISTYVYRKGILGADFGYATAIGLFNSLINVVILLSVNKISKKVKGVSIF
ncbi:ABC transporter permease [Murimonas intestini]|uniref:Aldouronate transport system permease protein n=1 Tax=Murimonas intestini TaxID=1337051 RepID=A0AB73T7Q9_9FIRM|nr:ABC transporter permease subunit [Murimonas intestini]MCR1841175.1 ABC transporter permease subunit [Murimonas intestini]MCR1866093.1 ABC transporter permease subunit [Murimonas intestini]MCR1882790.1 ABC transporter permease subunit [Murimonas intestini]